VKPGKRFSVAGLTFVVTVLAEIAAFIVVGHVIGYGWAFLALVALSGFGVWLLRREGVRTWRRFREVSEAGGRPGPQLTRALVGLLGAVLIAVPGFITAVLGLALFVPPVRALAGRGAIGLATRRLAPSVMGDLFGPRRVRVRTGAPTREPVMTPGGPAARPVDESTPIEGEIV
jgi:UPF0716 protein FxsA